MTSENSDERGDGETTRPENYDESAGLAERSSPSPAEVDELAETGHRSIGRFIASSVNMSVTGNPIASKMNESHLTEIIGLMGKEQENEHADRQRTRLFWGIMVAFVILVSVGFAVFLALNDMDSLLSELVKGGAARLRQHGRGTAAPDAARGLYGVQPRRASRLGRVRPSDG